MIGGIVKLPLPLAAWQGEGSRGIIVAFGSLRSDPYHPVDSVETTGASPGVTHATGLRGFSTRHLVHWAYCWRYGFSGKRAKPFELFGPLSLLDYSPLGARLISGSRRLHGALTQTVRATTRKPPCGPTFT